MSPHTHEIRKKTVILTIVVIVANVSGNFFLSMGMKEVGRTVSASPMPYLHALLDPWVIGGVCLLALWLIANLSLLSWADLSYVLPVTATAYVIAAILGRVVMNEHVTKVRWAGILLIMSGAIIVGRTTPRTTPEHEQDFANGDYK